MNWKKIGILLTTVAFAAAVAGCGSDSSKKEAAKETKEAYHLRVGHSPSLCQAPLFVAYQKGYFKDEGIDAEMIQIDAAHASDAVAADQIDVYMAMASKMIQPIENGLPVKATAGLHSGCVRILVPKDSPVQTLADLKGKKIGVPGLADSGAVIAKRALHAAGVSVTDQNLEVEFSVFSRNDLPQALQNGAVDAIAMTDPVGAIAEKEYGLRVLLNTATDPMFANEYCCISVVTEKLAKEHPEIAEKATRAIMRGALFTQKHPEEAAKIELDNKYVAGNLELNTELLKSYNYKPSVKGGYDAIELCAKQLAGIGLIKADTDAKAFADAAFAFFEGLEDTPAADSVE